MWLFRQRSQRRDRISGSDTSLEPPLIKVLRERIVYMSQDSMAELFSVDDPIETDAGYKLIREYIGTHTMTDLAK
jgi:hypothetical protein